MECFQVALKTSISRKEMAFKNPQVFLDDLWAVNFQNGPSSNDDSIVDELLDFSNDPAGFIGGEEEEEEENACAFSVSPKHQQQKPHETDKLSNGKSFDFSSKDDFGYVPASELGVPADDLASLEWLSHFVEDTNSEYSAPFPATVIMAEKPKQENDPFVPENPVLMSEPCFKTPIPAKARSKRSRTGVRVWSLGSPYSLTESSSSSSSTTSSSSSDPSSPCFIFTSTGMAHELTQKPVYLVKPPTKRLKKRHAGEGAGGAGSQVAPRRCSHCGVQKTPQWRTGPLGAKTLCNACGVRFKSGRLMPEYRPACSPTFSSELHSNHHRKVLEMRRKKEIPGQEEPVGAPLDPPDFE